MKTLSSRDQEARRRTNPAASLLMEPALDQRAKVERFLKLGYQLCDILRVLESLRHDAQTNDILEELIKTCPPHPAPPPSTRSLPNSPKLVARGCSPAPSQRRRGEEEGKVGGAFRPVVIDGSNVAMSYGDKKVFSCRGLQLAVDWFWNKGLCDVTVFVPLWRKEQPQPEAPITDQHILHELERRRILVYTPSRCVNGKRVVCYDDRYIVKLAFDLDGIIVSNDNYRDLQTEKPQWKRFIQERLLMYTFANNMFMPPDDPLGRKGPTIDQFLRKKPWIPDNRMQPCPYGKKCTYGVKCKFFHPERAHQSQLSVADELRALRDRARHQVPTPPTLADKPSHTASHSQDEAWGPRSHTEATPDLNLSLEVDEAFSSMENSMSGLYIQDLASHPGGPMNSSSSGVASYSDYIDLNVAVDCCQTGHRCQQCKCGTLQTRMFPSAWNSCPTLPPAEGEQQCVSPPSDRWRLTQDLQVQRGGVQSPSLKQRRDLRSQLSTLFPQSTVETVMAAYPHVTDVARLVSLIQSYRSSHIPF